MSSGGGGGKGKISPEYTLPPGFRSTSTSFGQGIKRLVSSSGYKGALEQGANFFNNLMSSPYVTSSLNRLQTTIDDPLGLSDPIIQAERERTGASLIERGRQLGGIGDSGTMELVSQGLGEFGARVADLGRTAATGAATALPNIYTQLGQALFTPFQAAAGAILPVLGGARPQTPQYANPKGGLYDVLGTAAGATLANPGFWSMFASAAPAAAASHSSLKENINPVSADAILEKIRSMPVSTWKYRGEHVKHMGPMAEDFYEAFELGNGSHEIAYIDAIGALMASVQALAAKVERLERRSNVHTAVPV